MLAFPHLLMSRNPLTYADLVSLVEFLTGVFVLFSSLGEAILIRGMDLEGGGNSDYHQDPTTNQQGAFCSREKEERGRQGNKGPISFSQAPLP